MSPKRGKPRRIIQAAVFDHGIGAVSAKELLAMREDDWGFLRDRLTDHRRSRAEGFVARCMMCEGEVFIQTRKMAEKRLPYFSHFKGNPPCPWHHSDTITPDAARAAQYDGQQESAAHRFLCDQIEQLAKLDSRYLNSAVGKYLPPAENEFGRYPDVYIEWRNFSTFAVEIQLSNTFQTEISARCLHYQREGVPLIWVLYNVDPKIDDIPQSFIDVIRRHRGNAFLLDKEAVDASKEQRTLLLKCYLKKDDGGFEEGVLTRIDKLTFPNGGLPYLEDRLTANLQQQVNAVRKPWFKLLEPLSDGWDWQLVDKAEIVAAFEELRQAYGSLSIWENNIREENFALLRLIAVVFSVVSTANRRERNYATRHPNIRAMLNTLLHIPDGIQRYALLIEELLNKTCLDILLEGTVGDHIQRAKKTEEGNLCLDNETEWAVIGNLVPEVFNSLVRQELIYLGALPAWATPIKRSNEVVQDAPMERGDSA